MRHKTLVSIACIISLLFSTIAQSYAATPCVKSGYTFGFFNGVWNTKTEAGDSLTELSKLQSGVLSGLAVTPHLFYNQTGCTTPGATCLQDLAETFIQRANELDSTGALAKDFTLFWESVTGNSAYSSKLSSFAPGLVTIFSSLYSAINAKLLQLTSLLLSSPPTSITMALSNAALDQLAADGQYFILVAHSQGNLFINQAYDHIQPAVGNAGVQVVHVAPASPTLRGGYILSSMDSVINGLAILGAMQPSNFALPKNPDDFTGHTLLGTYLNNTLVGATSQGVSKTPKQAVTDLIGSAMASLAVPADPPCPACSSLQNPLTLAQYNQISPAMTYSQVNTILGCFGTLNGPAGIMPESYIWSRIAMPSVQFVTASFFSKVFDPVLGSVKAQSGLQ